MGGLIVNDGKNLILHRTFLNSPTKTPPSVFAIGTGTTEPQETNTSLQNMITGWYNSGNFKPIMTSYPIFNETDKKTIIRCHITSAEANNNNISEFAMFNTDTTKIMFDRHVFIPVVKNSQTEIIFEVEYQII